MIRFAPCVVSLVCERMHGAKFNYEYNAKKTTADGRFCIL